MKIQNKTKLRQIVVNSCGNTGSCRNLYIFDDGTWELYSVGTSIPNTYKTSLREIILWGNFSKDVGGSFSKGVTEKFKDIEEQLEDYY